MKTLEHYHYKPLSKKNLSDMMEIERQIYPMPWSAGQMRDSLSAAHCQVWGLYLGSTSQLVGYGILSLVLDEVELLSLGVSKDFQRQGLGEKLLRFLIDKSADLKAKKMFLEVPANNEGAISLYKKLNFNPIGLRARYYRINSEEAIDAILMCLEIKKQ